MHANNSFKEGRAHGGMRCVGFTLIELLVVVAVIAVLAGLLLPAISKAKSRAQAIACLGNIKQCHLAWHLYAVDNNDRFVSNEPLTSRHISTYSPSWSPGYMSYDHADSTNVALLVGRGYESLGPYVQTWRVFKCPADKSVSRVGGGPATPRVRSFGMNLAIGSVAFESTGIVGFRNWADFGKLRGRSPDLFVFIDEHADSLGSAQFSMDWSPRGRQERWNSVPGNRHGGTATLSFVDGRAEIRRWTHPNTLQPERGPGRIQEMEWLTRGNPDFFWLRERFTIATHIRE